MLVRDSWLPHIQDGNLSWHNRIRPGRCVSFEFVKQNWKILLRYALYGILPLAFVGALSLNSLMQTMMDVSSGNSMFGDELSYSMLFSYALLFPTSLVAYIWIGTVVFSMMQFYNAHDEGLQGVTFQELKPSFCRNAWRLFKCGLVGSLIGIVFLSIFLVVIALGEHGRNPLAHVLILYACPIYLDV